MVELANMPTVCEIASRCDFEESDDLAGLLSLLRAKATAKTRIFAAISPGALGVDDSEMAIAPPIWGRPVFFRDDALAARSRFHFGKLNQALFPGRWPNPIPATPPFDVRTPHLHGAPTTEETSKDKHGYQR